MAASSSLAASPADRGDRGEWRLLLRRRADRKIAHALRIESLRLGGLSHERIRVQLGLSVEEYRRARRWLRDAVARSIASPTHLSIEEALREHGSEMVSRACRLGALRLDGHPRAEVQRMLRISGEEYEAALEWLRDAIAQSPRSR